MTETAPVPLGTLLSLHLRLPLADQPGVVAALVAWMTRGKATQENFMLMVGLCAQAALRQHPWLARIRFPDDERPRDMVWAWAWLDTQEMRYGAEHQVEQLPEDFWPPKIAAIPLATFCDQGHLHGVDFADLPKSVQQYLLSLGYQAE